MKFPIVVYISGIPKEKSKGRFFLANDQEGPALDGWQPFERVTEDGKEIPGLASSELRGVWIGCRQLWIGEDGREHQPGTKDIPGKSHTQAMFFTAGGPVVLTAKGEASRSLAYALDRLQSRLQGPKLAGINARSFWVALGDKPGKAEYEQVGKEGQRRSITRFTCLSPDKPGGWPELMTNEETAQKVRRLLPDYLEWRKQWNPTQTMSSQHTP